MGIEMAVTISLVIEDDRKFLNCLSSFQVLAISGLWNTAMAHPNDQEFIELGIFECMAQLIWKGIEDRHWLAQDQNIYIPYYAAHIIGSYTMNMEEFAGQAVRAGIYFCILLLFGVDLSTGAVTGLAEALGVLLVIRLRS